MLEKTLDFSINLINRVMYEGAYSSVISYSLERDKTLNKAQKSYVSALSFGVIENWILLNHYIDLLAKKRIKKNIRTLLLCALYEIEFMEENLEHLSVNAYVSYVKKNTPYASGFVNAILRSHLRSRPVLDTPRSLKDFALLYSHPLELARLWADAYGLESAIKIMAENQKKPPISLRVNSKYFNRSDLKFALESEGVRSIESPYSKSALIVESLGKNSIDSLDAFKKGMFYIQDISSIVLIDALNLRGDERVLDLCSSPGGKGLGVAERLSSGRVMLCDVSQSKVGLINDNAKRLRLGREFGSDVIENIVINDASLYNDEFESGFDVVLADVPCSGLGLIRKKPEIKYTKKIKKLKSMLELQEAILRQASRYVKPGGVLVYSTCTMNPQENDERIDCFLEKNSSYTNEEFSLGEIHGNPNMSFLTSNGYSDGFYISMLRRT